MAPIGHMLQRTNITNQNIMTIFKAENLTNIPAYQMALTTVDTNTRNRENVANIN